MGAARSVRHSPRVAPRAAQDVGDEWFRVEWRKISNWRWRDDGSDYRLRVVRTMRGEPHVVLQRVGSSLHAGKLSGLKHTSVLLGLTPSVAVRRIGRRDPPPAHAEGARLKRWLDNVLTGVVGECQAEARRAARASEVRPTERASPKTKRGAGGRASQARPTARRSPKTKRAVGGGRALSDEAEQAAVNEASEHALVAVGAGVLCRQFACK